MGSLNRVQLIGNLGRDPELRYTADGTPVCNFSVATTDSWTTKAGEKQEKTEWHRISMWGKLGEIAGQYLKKGRQVYVEGSLRTSEYTDKEGVVKQKVEVRADRMVMLNSGGGSSTELEGGQQGSVQRPTHRPHYNAGQLPTTRASPAPGADDPNRYGSPEPNFNDDDIPF